MILQHFGSSDVYEAQTGRQKCPDQLATGQAPSFCPQDSHGQSNSNLNFFALHSTADVNCRKQASSFPSSSLSHNTWPFPLAFSVATFICEHQQELPVPRASPGAAAPPARQPLCPQPASGILSRTLRGIRQADGLSDGDRDSEAQDVQEHPFHRANGNRL